ncbi:hypothetical protein R5W23_002964 [Gemmata sp. JC673]|uniref:Uncharacterized protein n=1 Tax=Gemmata algarum TaxID=2975278 RepID=A0ABU5F3G4_9BACT|nr:hypothetical protein [Gemmata algarum]MDY3561683.1 hypothetical protein [Gemmata algarum]
MAKKKQRTARTARRATKKSAKARRPKQAFGLRFSFGYNKLTDSFKLEMCVTGGRWVGRTVRAIGKAIRPRVLISSAVVTLAAALARMGL